MNHYQSEMDVALEAARLAGETISEHYATLEAIPDAPASISTETDRASQDVILSHIQRFFPNDALSAEETTETLAKAEHQGERLWIVDPIDGTRGFARKNDEFSVMIGFVHQGTIQLGVVLEPAKNRLTYARRGNGCWQSNGIEEPRQCRVSSITELKEATLTQSHSRGEPLESWAAKLLGMKQVKESYSAGVKLAMVARGEADIYINTYTAFRDWDICAGQILVEEAGGSVSGLAGEVLEYGLPGAWQRAGLLATNGHLQETVLSKLKSAKKRE